MQPTTIYHGPFPPDGVCPEPARKTPCQLGDHADQLVMMLSWGLDMVRDDDLLRALLIEIEADPDPLFMFSIDHGSSDEERIKYFHLRLLVDAGFLEETGRNGTSRIGGVFRMTMQGHDFLILIRRDDNWGKVKAAGARLGGASLRMLGEIAYALAAYALAKAKLRSVAQDFGISLD